MSTQVYDPTYHYLNTIYISQIVFDETEFVTLFGYLVDEKKKEFVGWDFLANFSQLNDMLLSTINESDTIIEILAEKLSQKYDSPTIIDVVNLFTKPIEINSFVFKVYKPHEEDENGEWKPTKDSCLFIDELIKKETFEEMNPFITFSKVENGKLSENKLIQAINNNETKRNDNAFKGYITILKQAQKQYVLLIKKGFSEKDARKRTGLEDELLFKMALSCPGIKKKK